MGPLDAPATTVLSDMRQESRLRLMLLVLVLSTIPSLLLSSSFPFELSDLIVPIGPPLTHVVHAIFFFVVTLVAIVIVTHQIVLRSIAPSGSEPNLGTTVPKMIAELTVRLGIKAEVQSFGGTRAGEIESVKIGRRNIVRIAANRLREAVKTPDEFRFIIAHELAHLAAGDPRTDRWVKSVYAVGGLFMAATFCGVLWNIGEGFTTFLRFGFGAGLSTLKTSWLSLFTNTASMGSLAILLFIESRSAMRLREFQADAVATSLVGPKPAALRQLASLEGGRLRRLVAQLVGMHPAQHFRLLALTKSSAAFEADRILFLLQGYFAATITEILMQMLFVNASPGVSTLAQRQEHLRAQLDQFPRTILVLLAATVLLSFSSQVLVFRRLRVTLLSSAGPRQDMMQLLSVPLLVAAGACLALASSQTFLWELSQLHWELHAWVTSDPDRAAVYAFGVLGTVIAVSVILIDNGRWSLTRVGTTLLGVIPVMCGLCTGLWFYGASLATR